ncbi:MAG: hypothetical protein LBS03_11260 [Bacteroidales bacterium]|nr:hypothetical protein [Bacteroidales bacterium]
MSITRGDAPFSVTVVGNRPAEWQLSCNGAVVRCKSILELCRNIVATGNGQRNDPDKSSPCR